VTAVDDILADVPMDQLAAQLGVDQATAEQAARQAIPALLGGMQANSQDPAGAMSLAAALGDHPSDLIDGGVDLNQVDPNDGEKIVGNIFGPNQDQVAQTLGGNLGGQAGGLIQRLLPMPSMSRMDPPDDCPPPEAAPPPSIELKRSFSGLLDPLAPPPRIEPSGSSWLPPWR
jgi:hypothetical protein